MYIATVISVIVTTVDIIHCGPSTGTIAVSSLGAAPAAATVSMYFLQLISCHRISNTSKFNEKFPLQTDLI